MTQRAELAALLDDTDLAGLDALARQAARRGDAVLLERIASALLDWLLHRWRERPLPRLGELITALDASQALPLGPATLILRDIDTHVVDELVWHDMLAVADTRDLAALFDAAVRARRDERLWRARQLREHLGASGEADPRVTARLLGWLERPPSTSMRSTDFWALVLDWLDAALEPRVVLALAAFDAGSFRPQSELRQWLLARVAELLETASAHPRAALTPPDAEGAAASWLDAAASCISGLAATAQRSPRAAARWPLAAAVRVVGEVAVPGQRVAARDRRGRLLLEHHDARLVVYDEQDRVLWHHDGAVRAAALSVQGRWLALWLDDASLELIELSRVVSDRETGDRETQPGRQRLPLPLPLADGSPGRRALCFAPDDSALYGALVQRHSATAVTLVLVETPLRLTADVPAPLAPVVVARHELAVGSAAAPVEVEPLLCAPAGDGLYVRLSSDVARRGLLLERVEGDWRLRHLVEDERALQAELWLEGGLYGRAGWLDVASGRFAADAGAFPWHDYDEAEQRARSHRRLAGDLSRHAATAVLAVAGRRGAPQLGTWFVRSVHGTGALDLHGALHALAVGPAGTWLVACHTPHGEQEARIERFDRERGETWQRHEGARFGVPGEPVDHLEIDTGGRRVVSVGRHGVRLWTATGEPIAVLETKLDPQCVALDAGGRQLAVAGSARVSVWHLHDDRIEAYGGLEPPGAGATVLAWDGHGGGLFVARGRGLWHWRPGAPWADCRLEHACALTALASRPGEPLLVGDAQGGLWRLEGDAPRLLAQALEPVRSLELGANGWLLVGSTARGHAGHVIVEPIYGRPDDRCLPRETA